MSTELEARMERLETTIAFQDQTIEDLTQALAEHYKLIESLRRELVNLGAQ